ncbi:MAG: DUF3426 domain-containing protein [Gammaproteobacteria bacterium]|nr:DUF3426 domain-containing protein [Gammaproteobacteria bacterium]
MYTRCPHCLTVFVVAAEQLKAAHGNVRCGTCLESFDAIPHLSDGPVQPPSEAFVEGEDRGFDLGDDDATEARIASEQLNSTLNAARAAASPDDGGSPAPEVIAAFETEESAPAVDGEPGDLQTGAADDSPGDEPVDRFAPAGHAASSRVSLLDESGHDVEEPLPDVLRVDAEEFAARSAARRRNIVYAGAALALSLLVAGQYVFFMPEDAARRYPQWRGAIESACVQIGCVLPERRDPARIRVLSRDVRVHPRYEGVMQIKATLTNAAPYRQPYPQVRFTLFNVNGQTIATRVFQPPEYLGRPVAASARLRPNTPFQVELDVLAPEEAAVSFEFQFL